MVDQRWIARRETLSAGTSAACRWRLAGPDVPRQHVLFDFRGRTPLLHPLPGMTGRLADGGAPRPLGGAGAVALGPGARGWVAMGDATILFQTAERPPAPPRRTLPAGARTGLASALEPRMLAILACVAVAEAFLVHRVLSLPHPPAPESEVEEAPHFGPIPRLPAPPRPAPAPDVPAPERPRGLPAAPPSRPPAFPELRREVARRGLAGVVAALRPGSAGAEVFRTGLDPSVADVFRDIRPLRVADTTPGSFRFGPPGAPGPIGIPQVQVAAVPSAVDLPERPPHVPVQVSFEDPDYQPPPGTPADAEALRRFVSGHLQPIRACYERLLKRHGAASGRLVVRFSLQPDGRALDASVDEDTLGDADLAACAVNAVSRWRLPLHPPEPVAIGFPVVLLPAG